MGANPSLFGFLFGRPKKRRASPKRKPAGKRTAAAPRKTPSIRTGRGPYGAATAKAARTRGRPKPPTAAQRRQMEQASLVSRFERGQLRGDELRRFLAGARTARNPGSLLEVARAQSRAFHGDGAGDVVELSAAEQRRYALPRYVVPIGRENATEYVAHGSSQRAGAVWRHRAGDRGRGQPAARTTPLKVADPRSGRVVAIGGSQRFDPRRGLVG